MVEKLVLEAFNALPIDLINDEFFKEIQSSIMLNISGARILQFSVSQDVYSLLKNNVTNVKININKSLDNLFYLTILSSAGLIALAVSERNDGYIVKTVTTNYPDSITMLFEKYEDISIVKVSHEVLDNKFILDYNYDVYYYDTNYNLLPIDVELEKDFHFSDKFGIPFLDARKYRNDFKNNAKFLNDSRAIDLMKFTDEVFGFDKYEFSVPFNIDNFEQFLNDEINRKMNEFDDGVTEYDNSTANFDSRKLAALLDPLKSQIDSDGQIVISANIFDNMTYYLLGFESTIYTNGFIIKKLDNEFILYYVNIHENNLIAIPQKLSNYDLEMIYNKNSRNENVPGLKEFLGLNRSR